MVAPTARTQGTRARTHARKHNAAATCIINTMLKHHLPVHASAHQALPTRREDGRGLGRGGVEGKRGMEPPNNIMQCFFNRVRTDARHHWVTLCSHPFKTAWHPGADMKGEAGDRDTHLTGRKSTFMKTSFRDLRVLQGWALALALGIARSWRKRRVGVRPAGTVCPKVNQLRMSGQSGASLVRRKMLQPCALQ